MSSTLSLLHFNDVYRVTPQKVLSSSSTGPQTIDVTQFAAIVQDLRSEWPQGHNSTKDGLLLFSGDVFSPSVESSVTRGSHMVPVLNQLGIDVALTGNHDFDFGYPHLSTLIKDTSFPWILSNIFDTTTSKVPQGLQEFIVIERAGLKIGIIGLVEEEWITTVASWPPNFVYKSMKETGIDLSKRLRDPTGQYKCDIIIALTHSRIPNDISLARELLALSPSAQKAQPIQNEHGVDLLLGGHDHLYYVGPGATSWDGFDVSQPVLGAEEDKGEVLVIKSGSDFRDLSSFDLTLESTPSGSIRTKVIFAIRGKRHVTQPGSKSSAEMKQVIKKVLSSVGSTLKAPICKTTNLIDVRSTHIRVAESAIGNWISDIVRHAYDETLCVKVGGGSDGVLLCAGTFRGDSTYGPGVVTLGDVLEILPFEDPVVVIEVDGETIWDALESSLKTWPAQEGRFPAISGFRVSWDSQKEPGSRVLGIWLLKPPKADHEGREQFDLEEEPILRQKGGKTYRVVTREYMAQGHDGFSALTRGKWLIDEEAGSIMSTIVRKYLMGTQFVNRLKRLRNEPEFTDILESTITTLSTESTENAGRQQTASQRWKGAARALIQQKRSALHYQNHLAVSATEHMSCIDAFDGSKARKGLKCDTVATDNEDLMVVSPEVDGRLKDEAKEESS